MQGRYIKSKVIQVSIPESAWRQLKNLADKNSKTMSGYVRNLIIQELQRLGLPIYITVGQNKDRADL